MKNIALVGIGFMGGMHAQVYQQLANAKLTAVVELDTSRAKTNLEKLGLKLPIYPNLEKLLSKEAVDVVDVCVPTDLHAQNAILAMNAKKHVFCEKPFALTVEEGKKILEAQKKDGVHLMVGHCLRFWPEYQALTDFVKSKKAGKLLTFALQRRSARPIASSDNWMNNPKRAIGAALDLHIHDTDFIHHLLGQPKAVTSSGTHDFSGWSHIMTQYHFDDIAVIAEGSWNYPPKWGFQMAFQVVFERGTVEYDSRAKPTLVVTLDDQETRPLPFVEPKTGKSVSGQGNLSALGGYFNELAYFIDRLEKNQPIEIANGHQALNSLRTTFSEILSATEHQTILL